MKKHLTLLIAFILAVQVFAQSPEKISYQAVIRDNTGKLVTESKIGIKISLLHGTAIGSAVYIETQTPTSNANGLVSLEIGSGTVISGDATTIDWGNGPFYIKTEIDPSGGTDYSIVGLNQLLSVPYALHAKTAETVIGGISESDPVFLSSEAVNINAGDVANLGNLSGVNTGDQDLSMLATKISLGDSTAQVRSEIPDVSSFLTSESDPIFLSSDAVNIDAGDVTNLGNLSGVNTGDQDLSMLATETALGDSTAQVRSEIPDVSSFLTSESDPVFLSSEAVNINASDISNLGNLSGVNTGDQDLSALATKTALGDSTAQVRSEIPDVSSFFTSESDPVFLSSEAVNINAGDISNLGNLSGVNTGDQDLSALATKTALGDSTAQVRSEIPDISGIATNTQAIQDTATQIRADIPTIIKYSIGDFAHGGIVFWVDESGQHGLVCAIEDQNTSLPWGHTEIDNTTATSGIYSGKMNTAILVALHAAKDFAGDYSALVCSHYSGGGFGDWYLPSEGEINLMLSNNATINTTAIENGGTSINDGQLYWSSTDYDGIMGRQWYANGGSAYSLATSKGSNGRVRAIRAF